MRQHHVFIRTNDLSGNLIKKIIYCNLYMDLHISFTVYLLCSISSAGADQCSENCTLTDVAQPVTVCILRVTDCVLVAACLSTDNSPCVLQQNTAPGLKYKFSGKCYERVKNGARPRNVWLRISTK